MTAKVLVTRVLVFHPKDEFGIPGDVLHLFDEFGEDLFSFESSSDTSLQLTFPVIERLQQLLECQSAKVIAAFSSAATDGGEAIGYVWSMRASKYATIEEALQNLIALIFELSGTGSLSAAAITKELVDDFGITATPTTVFKRQLELSRTLLSVAIPEVTLAELIATLQHATEFPADILSQLASTTSR